MPDPREPGQQHPPDRTGWEQPQAPEPEWTEPEWREHEIPLPPANNFNRERFLLRIVAGIIGVQFGLYILAGFLCSYASIVLLDMAKTQSKWELPSICPKVQENIRQSTSDSLAVLLALLGGGTMAIAESRRRARPDPRGGDRLPPTR